MRKTLLTLELAAAVLCGSFFLFCAPRQNPYQDPNNVDVKLWIAPPADSAYARIGDTVTLSIGVQLSNLVDSITVSFGENELDTTLTVFPNENAVYDTIQIPYAFKSAGTKHIVAQPYLQGTNTKRGVEIIVRTGAPAELTSAGTIAAYGTAQKDSMLTLVARATGTDTLRYQWLHNGSAITDATRDSLILPKIADSDTGTYRCIVANAWGADTSGIYTIGNIHVSPLTYMVTYDGNGNTGGSVPVDGNAYTQGATVTVKANGNLVKVGYGFMGWNTLRDGTGTPYAAGQDLVLGAANATLYAQWAVDKFTITFASQGGSAVNAEIVNYGGLATAPAVSPTRTGYTFSGWFKDSLGTTAWVFARDTVTTNVTLYAKWKLSQYTVTFDPKGGSAVNSQVVNYGGLAASPVAPNRTGYTFAGWYKDTTGTVPWVFSIDTVIANVTLYAKWTASISYTVTFNSQGGSAVAPQSVSSGGTATTPIVPTKTSYTFAGWYSDLALTTAFIFTTPITSTITLYAKWEVRDIDGNVYDTVRIGSQVWMVENLKTTHLNNDTAIQLVTDGSTWNNLMTPAYCWQNNDSTNNKNTYGALYNWYAVNTGKLAPSGWHVPTDSDWSTLATFLGGDTIAGGKLKEVGTAHWQSPNTAATNVTGFSALPGGLRDVDGFKALGTWGTWWSSSVSVNTYSWSRYIYYNVAGVYRYDYSMKCGFSVRCVRD